MARSALPRHPRRPTQKRRKRPTAKELAALANASIKTVTAVIDSKPGMRTRTNARVRETIANLAYQPDHTAYSLQNGRRRTIA